MYILEVSPLDNKKLKGIIFTPSYGLNGESAEAEVAALAKELGIPVVIHRRKPGSGYT